MNIFDTHRKRDVSVIENEIISDYTYLLNQWVKSAHRYIFTPSDRPELSYYGDGSNGWGVQTNQKAFAAFAVAAVLPGGAPDELETALKLLRYSLETHIAGSYHVTDGDDVRWGHTWISALGVERMMHGVLAIWQHLTDYDKALLRDVLISEADWLLENHPVKADPIKNVPESNMWNGALLYRTSVMYPDAPNAAAYREKGLSFILNSISTPSEQYSAVIYEGKPMSEWFVGGNFFDSFALYHHSYLNVGYMVVTLSNAAMLHFTLRQMGITPPPALYHNFEKVWRLVRSALFDDGRLFRFGGDTRVRYCYCQDYLLPAMAMACDAFGDNTDSFERGWIQILRREMEDSGDGSFLSKRCELFLERSLLYYTRLESDRAVSISFAAYYRYLYNSFCEPYGCGSYTVDPDWRKQQNSWHDDFHGSCFIRDSKRFASFTWRAAEPPQGMCVPLCDSSLAEWKNNMTSFVTGDGYNDSNTVIEHHDRMLEGGFITSGRYVSTTEGLLAEQTSSEKTICNSIAFAALPDEATVVTLQYATAVKNVSLTSVKGLYLNIPNDVFNKFKREYIESGDGRYICVDGKLGVVSIYGDPLTVHKPPYRQIGLRKMPYKDRGMLHCDEICTTLQLTPRRYQKNECVFDFGVVVVAGAGVKETAEVKVKKLDTDNPLCRMVSVTGQNGIEYIIAANFGYEPLTVEVRGKTATLEAGRADIF